MLLFLVPDEPDDDAVESEESSKAQLDDGGPTSKAMRKVDLDLDDTPFLEDEEEEEEEEEDFETEALEEPEEKKGPPAWLKNKLVWVAAVVILVLLGVIVKLLFFTAPPPAQPPEEPAVEEPAPEPEPAPAPAPPPPPETAGETLLRLEPFWVEQVDTEGDIRFLIVRIVLATDSNRLARDFKRETLLVRNAVYYYLRNKDLEFLSDKNNSERLKKELLTVINQYMSSGQFESLLFEEYLVK